ncbi:response regulator [Pseudomonadota bacterium]
MPLAFCKRLVGMIFLAVDAPGDRGIKKENNNRIVVLVEPDASVRDALTVLLEEDGWEVEAMTGCAALKEGIGKHGVIAVISESSLPGCTPQEILEIGSSNNLPVIFTGHDLSLQGAVDLIRQGALDFLDKPFPQTRLLDLLQRLK